MSKSSAALLGLSEDPRSKTDIPTTKRDATACMVNLCLMICLNSTTHYPTRGKGILVALQEPSATASWDHWQ